MNGPINEQALLSEFSRRSIAAVLLRSPTPFAPAVFAAAKDFRIIDRTCGSTIWREQLRTHCEVMLSTRRSKLAYKL